MNANDELGRRLQRLGRQVAPSEPIVDDVMRRIDGIPARRWRRPAAVLASATRMRLLAPLAAGLIAGMAVSFFWLRPAGAERDDQTAQRPVPMRIASIDGDVLVRHRDGQAWRRLTPSSKVYAGDRFHTPPESKLVLALKDESTVGISSNSVVSLSACDGGMTFELDHGTLRASLQSPHAPFFVQTPQGRVEALGTEMTVTVR